MTSHTKCSFHNAFNLVGRFASTKVPYYRAVVKILYNKRPNNSHLRVTIQDFVNSAERIQLSRCLLTYLISMIFEI